MVEPNSCRVLLYSPQQPARWSYFLAQPVAEFKARKNEVEIISAFGDTPVISSGRMSFNGAGVKMTAEKKKVKKSVKPLYEFEKFFKKNAKNKLFDQNGPPFQGGAVGYFSYEALHYLEDVPLPKSDDVKAPWIDFQFFDSGAAYDHWEKKVHVFGPGKKTNALLASFQAALKQLRRPSAPSGKTGKIVSNFSKTAYVSAVEKIKTHVASGETFQANLSQRFSARTTKTPWDVFVRLNQVNPSPYSAFFQSGDLSIVSASPELLFSLSGNHLVTRPIAGTRPRGKTLQKDAYLEVELKENAKENAEHAMLVDLERNDVGRICNAGSVKVQDGFVVEKYSHVQHLVSQVEGRLQPGKTAFDALRALFPGGTITGCPKVRTMQLLRDVEPLARGPYTGSLGWIGWNGDAAFNILIRTIYFKKEKEASAGSENKGNDAKQDRKNGKEKNMPAFPDSIPSWCAYFHAGGGIVWDSVPEKEYAESLQKAEAMRLAIQ